MTNIEKRVDKIVESLSVEKLIQFGIAQALSFDSHTEWFLAFCKDYDEVSAYIDKVRTAFTTKMEKRYLPVVAPQKISDAFYRVQFLVQLCSDCNVSVDDLTGEMLLRLALLAEKQSALAVGVPTSLNYGRDLGELLEDLLRMELAIATIRDQYFEGRPILFKEYNVKLGVLIAEAKEMALLYNKIIDAIERTRGGKGHLPQGRGRLPKLDIAEIKLAATKSCDTLAQSFVNVAESRAQAARGNKRRARDILISETKGNQHQP
jgi:hypothetical protein